MHRTVSELALLFTHWHCLPIKNSYKATSKGTSLVIRLECSFGADGEGKTERESASDELVIGRFATMGESAWA